jgi:hypothetical protein
MEKTIQINTIIPANAEKKALALQAIANVLDTDNLEFIAALCKEKGNDLNSSLRANANLIRNNL